MMTTACARELMPVWLKEPNSHMGTFFAEKLGYEWQEHFKAVFVYPPIGGFFTHKSTTCSTGTGAHPREPLRAQVVPSGNAQNE